MQAKCFRGVFASGTTDRDGLYEIAVPAGRYAVVAIDLESSCDSVRKAYVRTVEIVPFYFDHGVY